MASRAIWDDSIDHMTATGASIASLLGMTSREVHDKFFCLSGGYSYLKTVTVASSNADWEKDSEGLKYKVCYPSESQLSSQLKHRAQVAVFNSPSVEIQFYLDKDALHKWNKKPVTVQFGVYTDCSVDYIGMSIEEVYKHLSIWSVGGVPAVVNKHSYVKPSYKLRSGDSLEFVRKASW